MPAAIGIKIVLYANAQKMFSLILLITFLENCTAATTFSKSPSIITISPLSIAISVPLPMATPMSA